MDDEYTPVTFFPELRARLGLGRERLAHLLKISMPTMNMWESGAKAPTAAEWNDIAKVITRYGDDVQDLLPHAERLAELANKKAAQR